jgi:hypothetical protein
MPLMNPNQLKTGIREVLKSSGLGSKTDSISKTELNNLLDEAGLNPVNVLDTLGSIMRTAEKEETRLQACKEGLKLNGFLEKDEVRSIPVVNIIIRDSNCEVNPILIPR